MKKHLETEMAPNSKTVALKILPSPFVLTQIVLPICQPLHDILSRNMEELPLCTLKCRVRQVEVRVTQVCELREFLSSFKKLVHICIRILKYIKEVGNNFSEILLQRWVLY